MGKFKKFFSAKLLDRSGQTLIETVAALFILVMGVTAASGLAIFAFNSSAAVNKQIIATGLAREGVEAIKNMRDTNWLIQTPIDASCYNYASSTANNASCYKSWLSVTGGFAIGTTSPYAALRLGLNSAYVAGPQIIWAKATDNANWGLDFDSNIGGASFNGFYKIATIASGVTYGTSDYYRQILLTEDSSGNFNHSEYHKLIVESRVWWTDKKCPRSATWPGLNKCSVSLITELTNWKNYKLTQ